MSSPSVAAAGEPAPAVPRATYRVGDLEIDARGGFIRRADGSDLYLRQQTLQVLLYLLEHRDRIVGKEELRQAIWADVAVTDDALVQCVVDIRRALGDDSRAPRLIKTVPKVGYRFVGPVAIAGVPEESAAAAPVPAAVRAARSRRFVLTLAAAGVALVLAAGAAGFAAIASRRADASAAAQTMLPKAPGVRRVAVLYFENQSGSREFGWLRQGLADMVITDLSRFDRIAVLSRQQLDLLLTRHGIGQDDPISLEDALRLGSATGAEAIVLGSFAAIGDRIRVEAKLVDAHTGRLLGAETATADRPDEVLAQVDVVALRVAGRLGVAVEQRRDGGGLTEVMTHNLEAYRYYVLGLRKSNALQNAEGIALLQKAVELDPEFAMAYARIGYTYAVTQAMPDRAKPYLQKAFELSSRLTDKDRSYIAAWYAIASADFDEAIKRLQEITVRYPLEVEAYWRLGAILLAESRPDDARGVLQRGLIVDPENAAIVNVLGGVYQMLGRLPDAIAMHRRYVELAPGEPNAYDSLGLTYQYAGMYDQAIDAYNRALSIDPHFEVAVVHLGNTYYQLGMYRRALEQYRRYLTVADFDVDRQRGHAAIAWTLFRQGAFTEAAAEGRRAEQIAGHPVFEQVLMTLGRGNPAAAERLASGLGRVVNRGTRGPRRIAEYVQGELALAAGRDTDALDHFRAALKHPPVTYSQEARDDCLASALLRLGRFDEAVAEYTRVLAINPQLPSARYGLAQALDRSGQTAQARAEYGRFLGIWSRADAEATERTDAERHVAASAAQVAAAARKH